MFLFTLGIFVLTCGINFLTKLFFTPIVQNISENLHTRKYSDGKLLMMCLGSLLVATLIFICFSYSIVVLYNLVF